MQADFTESGLKEVVDLARKAKRLVEKRLKPRPQLGRLVRERPRQAEAIGGLLAHGLRLVGAIEALLEAQWEREAEVLLRALLETLVNARYITSHGEAMAKRFLDWKAVDPYRLVSADEERWDPQLVLLVKEEYEGLDPALKKARSWSDKKIKEMMKEVFPEGPDYELYRVLSWFSHASSFAVGKLLQNRERHPVLLTEPRGPKGTFDVPVMAGFLLLWLVEVAHETYHLGLRKSITTVERRLVREADANRSAAGRVSRSRLGGV